MARTTAPSCRTARASSWRSCLALCCALLVAVPACLAAPANGKAVASASVLPKLVLAGPYASVSNPLIHMVDSGALADVAREVSFITWRDPDQLRVLALKGGADVLAMPVNVAANLYNRGAEVQLLNVSTWGVLYLVSRDANLKTLADLRGKEVAMPFRGDMPDILFGLLADAQGIDTRRDLSLRYVATPIDAMQLLVMRRVDHALLAEPAVSMALRKTGSFPLKVIAPELHRSVNLQQEWGRVYRREARIPQAGIAAMGKLRAQPALLARIEAEYARSLAWCNNNPDDCGKRVAARIDLLMPEAVADSVRAGGLDAVPAVKARPEVEFLFDKLLAKNPALIGGKKPDDGFYGGQRP
ncbi:MAG: ABC transporter substrate-binding protein [Gammaproteobacteria bacterium]